MRLSLPPAFLLCAVAACAPASVPDASREGAVDGYASLVSALRAGGLSVQPAGEIEQPFFTAKAKVIVLEGAGEAQVYEYPSESQAAADAAKVNRDGSIGGSMPMWIAPPHFFRKGSLLVLYLGSDERVLGVLRKHLGQRFAPE